jgi:hypothetical protein
VPFKANAARRHHIPKQRHKVTNWSAYDAALRRRASLTVWFTDEAVAAWRAEPRTTPGGQPFYSALAITTAPTLRAVSRLALRQAEGLIGSILRLLGLDLPCRTTPRSAAGPRRCRCRARSPAANPCTCWWTAPGCGWAGPASGCSRSTAAGHAGHGRSRTSARTPTRAGSSRRS